VASVQITNTGEYAGHEVAQLYLSFPQGHGQPVKMLKGFQKLMVSPNQRVTFSFPLVWDDVSVHDVDAKGWKVLDGQYAVLVGASSADIRLTGSFECKTNVCGNSGLVE
jgi:beta-glucosidase